MSGAECRYEADVLAAVSTGRWPDAVDPAMRAHVSECALCRDLITVVAAFDAEKDMPLSTDAAHLPGSGAVWFRAQLRARQDAARLAVRPISVAQALAFAGTVGVLGALFGATTGWFQQGVRWMGGAVGALRLGELGALLGAHFVAASATVAGILLAAGAIYLLVRLTEREA